MRSNYLITEVAKSHDVDLLALNQSKLLEAYYPTKEEGLRDASRVLGECLAGSDFFDFSNSTSELGKKLLAAKSLFASAPYSVAWFENGELANAISEKIAGTRYDVVHFDTVGLAQYRSLVKDVPTVLDHHNVESHMMLRRAEKERNILKKMYYFQEGLRLKRYEQKVLSSFNGHITCSEVDSARLLELSATLNVKAIPNAIRLDGDFELLPKKEKAIKKLLFIGGLDWYPNADAVSHFIEEIWPLLSSTGIHVELDIVGKNPPEALLEYAGKNPGINVHGFVDDIDEYYQNGDVFICPIRDGGGTKLKVLDAMAHSMPVVGYPEAFEGIEVTDEVDSALAKSPGEFAAKIQGLINDAEKAASMGLKARELIEAQYEAVAVGESLNRYYAEIAGCNPA